MSIKIETVSTDTFSMDFFRFGDGDQVLVILPGISAQSVMGLADAVADEYRVFMDDYTVYVFDRRKELPDVYPVREMAGDTAKAIRAMGLKNINLFGASQGGMIAMDMAIEQPDLVQKLAVASTSACVDDEQYNTAIAGWVRLARMREREKLYLTFGADVLPQNVFEQSKDMLFEASETVTDDELDHFIILAEGMKGFDVTKELGKITCPVLVTGSLDDHVLGALAAVKIAGNLNSQKGPVLYMYNGYGHAVYDTAPDFRERLLEWFQR